MDDRYPSASPRPTPSALIRFSSSTILAYLLGMGSSALALFVFFETRVNQDPLVYGVLGLVFCAAWVGALAGLAQSFAFPDVHRAVWILVAAILHVLGMIGFVVAAAAALFAAWSLNGVAELAAITIVGTVLMVIPGAMIGVVQWALALRQRRGGPWWILHTALGWGFAGVQMALGFWVFDGSVRTGLEHDSLWMGAIAVTAPTWIAIWQTLALARTARKTDSRVHTWSEVFG